MESPASAPSAAGNASASTDGADVGAAPADTTAPPIPSAPATSTDAAAPLSNTAAASAHSNVVVAATDTNKDQDSKHDARKLSDKKWPIEIKPVKSGKGGLGLSHVVFHAASCAH